MDTRLKRLERPLFKFSQYLTLIKYPWCYQPISKGYYYVISTLKKGWYFLISIFKKSRNMYIGAFLGMSINNIFSNKHHLSFQFHHFLRVAAHNFLKSWERNLYRLTNTSTLLYSFNEMIDYKIKQIDDARLFLIQDMPFLIFIFGCMMSATII